MVICQARIEGGWNSAPNTQYHIQTDEGEERYFRYQTLTGQYRKEKRLQDGSVVGTYGWVDADGYLRLKDYVADEQGYRIVRSKKLYVGGSTPIDAAVQSSKYAPSEVPLPGVSGVQYKPVYNSYVVDNSLSFTSAPYNSNYHAADNSIYSTQAPYAVHSTTQTPYPAYSTTQSPYASHSSIQSPYASHSSTQSPYASYSSTESPYTVHSTASPYTAVSSSQPPHYESSQSPQSSTPSPYVASSTQSPYLASSTESPYNNDYASPVTDNSIVSSTVSSNRGNPYDDYINSKGFVSHEKPLEFPSYHSASSNLAPVSLDDYLKSETEVREVAITPHYRYSISTTPTPPPPVYERVTEAPKPVTFRPYYNPNVVFSGFNSKDKTSFKEGEYDGVSLTHDGFKYYLPKHYHEEEGSSSSHRAGSFGYVDPFGIRRVIYYNTSPEKGFVHRKNNRYVGFNAPPYDPRF